MKPIYLDYNATTPVDSRVKDAMIPYITEHFGNPSSSHIFGVKPKLALESARTEVAKVIGANSDEIIFTSCGSESNNMAIFGICLSDDVQRGKHVISTTIEVIYFSAGAGYYESLDGADTLNAIVNEHGFLNPEEVTAAVRADTALVTIIHANNEVGTIQQIGHISSLVKAKNPETIVHTDCAQSVGKVPLDVNSLGVDLLTIAGHKIYAPKGVGALYIKRGTKISSLLYGGGQEKGLRSGTENVMLCVGLGEACRIARVDLAKNIEHYARTRAEFYNRLRSFFPSTSLFKINGSLNLLVEEDEGILDPMKNGIEICLPNTLNISIKGLPANIILDELQDSVAISAGAACHTEEVTISPVLAALGVPLEYAIGTLRVSVGRETTSEDVENAVNLLFKSASKMISRNEEKEDVDDSLDDIDAENVKLTRYTTGMGCACKMRPQALEQVLKTLPIPVDPNVLVGFEFSDDAGVYRFEEGKVVVISVDFFTPVVDDPYVFGQIAAANAVSDLYAMGIEPKLAVSIAAFPTNRLPLSVFEKILHGAQSKAAEAGVLILGGHTIDDNEPKFGLCVIGFGKEEDVLSVDGLKDGDVLLLTKPIGVGILSSAQKRQMLDEETRLKMEANMAALNDVSLDIVRAGIDLHALTDVTGFGLLGHLLNMVRASNLGAEINAKDVPLLPRVYELCGAGVVPGGTKNNHLHVSSHVRYDSSIPIDMQMILCDAQTNGGLLMAVAKEDASIVQEMLTKKGIKGSIVGSVNSEAGMITVR